MSDQTKGAPEEEPARTQAIHLSDRKGRSLVSVFVRADDSFQVVDERGNNRNLLIDTLVAKEPPAPEAPVKTLEAFT